MAWVTLLGEDEVTGELRARYEADLNQLGFVMEATRALSPNPPLAVAVDAFEAAVKRTSHLAARERRLIHLVVADRVRSTYCVLVYAAALERDLGGAAGVRMVLGDYRTAPQLSTRERAILDYAVAAAVGHPTPSHVAALREEGLDDAAIVDVAVTACLRLFGSRVYDALGIETDPFFLEQQDLVQAAAGRGEREA
ncbi:MAG TPA: hypothetical protein VNN19_08130 [bacterium]|nr:hypothetical protein [bacterium]